jgi:hypothetical protein
MVFAPEDKLFISIMEYMKKEQEPYVVEFIDSPVPPGGGDPPGETRVVPNSSTMGAASAHVLDPKELAVQGIEHTRYTNILVKNGLHGYIPIHKLKQLDIDLKSGDIVSPEEPKPDISFDFDFDSLLTPSEQEKKWRDQIEDIKRWDYNPNDPLSRSRIIERSANIKRMFGKGVKRMTAAELKSVLAARKYWEKTSYER